MWGVGGIPRPRRELADEACKVAVDEAGEHVGEVGGRIDTLQHSIKVASTAQFSAPSSEPANKAFLRFSAIGRIDRSTGFESSSMRPSPRERVRPSQRARV
jgi:hypothetical protein